ncbi:MAG: dihydrolipoyl dehydrogenase family protein, partial [Nitrospinaceae bacterium]
SARGGGGIRPRVSGRAKFIDSHTVAVAGQDPIAFDHCILATGSRPIMPANLDIDSPLVMDSTAALELEEIPDRLLIVGGGYIGLEMGTVYSALGSRVHVVEMTGGLLPGVDRDLVRILQVRLRKAFEAINLKTKLVALEKQGSRLKAVLDGEGCSGDQIYDRVLIAVGRRPNTENLGLESTQVELDDKGYIRVNAHRQTADPSIYAIGDVVGGAMLAHKASHEGRMAVEAMTGDSAPAGPAADFDSRVMPAVVFTDPEVAWCGLTEQEAQGQGRKVVVAKFPWGASGRAATVGRQDGLTKLILEPETDRILGVGLVGAGAGELIAEGVLAVEMGAVAGDLALTIHPHPTLSETLMEAAEVHAGHATHVFRRR